MFLTLFAYYKRYIAGGTSVTTYDTYNVVTEVFHQNYVSEVFSQYFIPTYTNSYFVTTD